MKRFVLFITDVVFLYLALYLTLYFRYGENIGRYFGLHVVPFSIIFVIWLTVFYISNHYDIQSLRNNTRFFSDFFKAVAIAGGISTVLFYFIPVFGIAPKTNLFLFILIFIGIDTAFRAAFNGLIETKFKKPILIVGLNPQALELAEFITANPQIGYTLKYIADIGGETALPVPQSIELIKDTRIFSDIVRNEKISDVVVSPEAYRRKELIELFYKSIGSKVNFSNLSSFYERLTGRVPLGAIDQIWFLENLSEGSKKFYDIAKRAVDIAAGCAIGILTFPFYPFIILAIKLDSPGPVLYKQKRHGRSGEIFEIIKFRTMFRDAEQKSGAVWAADNDPRITGIGKFLRKTRIDELPQIWNILKGEMSLVGPRAERPEFHADLTKEIPYYDERYLVKPGLSGWAQVKFRYGSSVRDAAEKLQYDLYYIKNRSIMLDLVIILHTIRIALMQAGR